MTSASLPALEARSLGKQFFLPRERLFGPLRRVTAVDDVSFSIPAGTTFGIVGESGSGKTTVAKMLLKLEAPTSGTLLHDGADIFAQSGVQERAYRRTVQAVLQDPYGALSPRLSVGMIIAEPMLALGDAKPREAIAHARHMLELVGLQPDALDRYPHQFSGGQRQRIAIARALSIDPRLIVLDEPVSALDVSIRAQILNLLRDLQDRLGLAYLFIAHDLAAVAHMSHEIVVMYLGKIVESGEARAIAGNPQHPYTRALFAAALPSHPDERREDEPLAGEVPSPLNPPSGCHFHPRCPHAMPRCAQQAPPLAQVGDRLVACHLFG